MKTKYGLQFQTITNSKSSNQRTAHPVGTTVRITDFLKHIPVRRQTTLKGAAKTLTKIKKLLQAYAFAKPSCRFSLKVLKGKNENNNWMYVPSSGSTISDAAVKIIGREASACCLTKDISSQSTEETDENVSSDGYNMTAFLPKPDAGKAPRVLQPGLHANVHRFLQNQ